MTKTLPTRSITYLLLLALAGTNACLWLAHITDWWALKAIVFVSVIVIPGIALFRTFRMSAHSVVEGFLFSFGLGIIWLMLAGLVLNQVFPLFGSTRVLELTNILIVYNIVSAALILWSQRRDARTFSLQIKKPQHIYLNIGLGIFGFMLPIVTAFGAFRLNNGSDEAIAMVASMAIVTVFALAMIFRKRLPDGSIAWLIFCSGLAVLLMTSLRSWDISGHDIAREFHVYNLTHLSGHWDIGAFRDPYNACLSITILPELFTKLLDISGLMVFKFVMQVIFALCPVVMYFLLRRYASKLGALVGVGLFISYPTFINDSAMLTRQGVAYLLFSLALLAVLHPKIKRVPRAVFLFLSLGVILSHYSTSYMFVAIFGLAIIARFVIGRIQGERLVIHGHQQSIVTPSILALLVLGTFLWYAQVTSTSGGLVATLRRSISNAPHLFSDDNKSSDTSVALFMASSKTQVDVYEAYLNNAKQPNKKAATLEYLPSIEGDDLLLTDLGKRMAENGIDPGITVTIRQHFGRILQVAAVAAVLYAAWLLISKRASALPADIVYLSLGGIVVTIVMVVMPNLSINYGVLRAFQQALIFLIIPLIILLAVLTRRINRYVKLTLATIITSFLFLLFMGFFAQLTGGVSPSLTLNNSGLYYGLYYTTRADIEGFSWMKNNIPAGQDVRTSSYAKALMHDPTYPFDETGILPSHRPIDGYVFLGEAQMVSQKFYVYHEGSPLITSFPLHYYQKHTDKIYSTPTTGVFR